VYPEITRPNAVTAFSGLVLQILHMCEKISKILLPGKGVKKHSVAISEISIVAPPLGLEPRDVETFQAYWLVDVGISALGRNNKRA